MRIIDNDLILKTKGQINLYRSNYLDDLDFYNNLNKLRLVSLQKAYFKNNILFIEKVKFIVSIISTIANNPHRLSKEEETLVRIEKAKKISVDDFNLTLKNPTLWKEDNNFKLRAEFVYSHEHIDDLLIYENLFIRLLIDYIYDNVTKIKGIYLNLLSVKKDNKLITNKEDVIKGLKLLDDTIRKIKFIKETTFYKAVSKAKKIDKNIKVTNILLKDRLYNFCYKFYKEYIVYDDYLESLRTYKNYCLIIFLKKLKKNGFVLKNNQFINDIFIIKLDNQNDLYTDITISLKNDEKKFTHRLYFSVNYDFSVDDDSNLISINYINLFNIYNLNNNELLSTNYSTENITIEKYVNKLIYKVYLKDDIYKKYCLCCRNSIEYLDGIYHCENCDSMYSYIDDKRIWLIK